MFNRSLPYLCLVILFLAAAGCDSDSNNSSKSIKSPDPTVVTTWQRTPGGVFSGVGTMILNSNLTFESNFEITGLPAGSDPEVSGSYVIDNNNEIVFTDSGGNFACNAADGSGRYGFDLQSAETMVLTLVSDSCTGRSSFVPGTWTNVSN